MHRIDVAYDTDRILKVLACERRRISGCRDSLSAERISTAGNTSAFACRLQSLGLNSTLVIKKLRRILVSKWYVRLKGLTSAERKLLLLLILPIWRLESRAVSTNIARVEFLFLIGRDNFLVSKPLSPQKTSLEPWRFSCSAFERKRTALPWI